MEIQTKEIKKDQRKEKKINLMRIWKTENTAWNTQWDQ